MMNTETSNRDFIHFIDNFMDGKNQEHKTLKLS